MASDVNVFFRRAVGSACTDRSAFCAVAISVACLFAPTAVHAQGFQAPAGCTAYLTVQMKGCLVSNHWRCDAEPEGNSWAGLYTDNGPAVFSQFNNEFQWLATFPALGGPSERLAEGSADPLSLTELLDNGLDSFDFEMEDPEGRTRVRGFDSLTGEEVEIDGERLLITDFQMIQTRDTDVVAESTGQQYVHPRWRLFFLGQETDTRDGVTVASDNSPVTFHEPGEPGFGATQPIYGCGAQDISFFPLEPDQ
ncbi:MAG: hypothetical protein AAF667_17775 [Pseudomonadota bacterium]